MQRALAEGARLLEGGRRLDVGPGWFYAPDGADRRRPRRRCGAARKCSGRSRRSRSVKDADEAIARAAASEYGLGANIYTSNLTWALTAMQEIKAGTFWINDPLTDNDAAPFGGMRKSGMGRELGEEGLDAFRETKHVHLDFVPERKAFWFPYAPAPPRDPRVTRRATPCIAVLGGAGAMGRIVVRDLAETAPRGVDIVLADRDLRGARRVTAALPRPVRVVATDAGNPVATARALSGASVIINACHHDFNLRVMDAALSISCHYLDLGGLFHVTRRQLLRHGEFKRAGLLALCGWVRPRGLSTCSLAPVPRGWSGSTRYTSPWEHRLGRQVTALHC